MPHIAVLGAGITGITTAFALHQRGFDVTCRDGDVFCQWRAVERLECRSLEPVVHGSEGAEVDAASGCAFVGEPASKLAQNVMDGGVSGQYPALSAQHD